MGVPEQVNLDKADELEEWFLAGLSEEKIPLDAMLQAVSSLVEQGDREQAEGCAELLQEALTERSDTDGVLRLLEARCGWNRDDEEFRKVCAKASAGVLQDRQGSAFVESVGFDAGLPLKECLRRLRVLMRLKSASFCHDRTWGFGIVKQIDEFYRKIRIDFDRASGHEMSFAYAAEHVEPVGDDHLLARKHLQPEELRRLMRESQGEVVNIALASYGEMTAARLKEILVAELLSEEEWKDFWQGARKQLKNDPRIDVPARRNEPIRFLAQNEKYGSEWCLRLSSERDFGRILDLVRDLERERPVNELTEDCRRVVCERLAYVIWAAESTRRDAAARALMAAVRLGFWKDIDGVEVLSSTARRVRICIEDVTDDLLAQDGFLGALSGLSAREMQEFVKCLAKCDEERTVESLLLALPRLRANRLNEAIGFLSEGGKEDACAERLKETIEAGEASAELLCWLCLHLDYVKSGELVAPSDLAVRVCDVLDVPIEGGRVRARNQLAKLFDRKDWIEELLRELSAVQRQYLLVRVRNSRGWDESGRRLVMARMIKLYPELEAVVASDPTEPASRPTEGLLTSWRSYRERATQLKELLEVTIPENSREIAEARSYGDLRENFEYASAKDRQRLLLQRKAGLEKDLTSVKGTDFEGFPTGEAGMGTSVSFSLPDGRTKRYCILGMWDRAENLGIIPSGSRIAEALSGSSVGDEVMLPCGENEEHCRIIRIDSLPDDVKEWIAGMDGEQ